MKIKLVLIFIFLMTIFIVPVHADDGSSAPKTLPSEFAMLLPTATVTVEGGILTLTPEGGGEPIVTEIAVTATPEGEVEVELGDKAFFDVSNLTLEHEIDPECVEQFPVAENDSGSYTMCVTFDNFVYGDKDNPIMLGGGY